MKVLLTGANGYIGSQLLVVLPSKGHHVVAIVRNKQHLFIPEYLKDDITVIEGDLLDPESLKSIPRDIDVAYYLVHSMAHRAKGFSELESTCARNFNDALSHTQAHQVIYLSGLSRQQAHSEHMSSRHNVEKILKESSIPVTVLRSGVIIGAGSASFEIMRDLVEKLPIMIAPKWVNSKCQPISIKDVIFYLTAVLSNDECLNERFELEGDRSTTYKEMLLKLAKIRHLKRYIISVPLLTPRLSSLWLLLITSTKFSIARALVNSLTLDAVCSDHRIKQIVPHHCLNFEEAVRDAFDKIEQHPLLLRWNEAIENKDFYPHLLRHAKVPKHGCIRRSYKEKYPVDREEVLKRLWKIGGKNGWYYMNWAWSFRGAIDRLFGGVGLRRGRKSPTELCNGDTLDFWRVILADREKGLLILHAEMKMPGEAWLDWSVKDNKGITTIIQTATFRPKGLLGRLYWYSLLPIHMMIFRGLCKKILSG